MIQKLSESDSAKTGLLEKADSIMQALLGVFQCDTTSVHEEAMLAVGALTYVCGQSFTKYMQSFYPVLELGLKNHRVGLLSSIAKLCRMLFSVHVCVLSDVASYNLAISQNRRLGVSLAGCVFKLGMQDIMTVLQLSSDVQKSKKNFCLQEVDVCIATVGVLGDICRAMDTQVAEFSDNIMQVLLQTLSDPTVDRSIKPQILSSFGDIALAVGDKFVSYLAHVLPMLQGAQHLSVEQQRSGNETLYDYNTQLRLGILEAYAGIVHALSNEKIAQYMTGETPVRLLWPHHVLSSYAERML